MSKFTILLSLPLLLACPSAEVAVEEPTSTPARDAIADLIPLDEDRIDAEEAFAEAMAPIAPTPTTSLAFDREAIPHHDPRFHDHFEEAVLALEDGSPADAVDALRLAVFDAPDSAPTWMLLAETYDELDRSRQAFDCASEALSHDRDLPSARAWFARHHLDAGDPEAARPHAERYAKLRPEDPLGSHLLSRAYMGLSMWDEAIRQGRKTISRDPTFVAAYNNLGFSALQVGRNELALQYLEAATELDGVEAYMLNNLGIAYERLDRPTDALQAFADAADLDPSYAPAVVNRDRVREVVDALVADEISRILAERARAETPDSEASVVVTPGEPDVVVP